MSEYSQMSPDRIVKPALRSFRGRAQSRRHGRFMRDRPMSNRFYLLRALFALVLVSLMSGCQPAMSTQPDDTDQHRGEPPMFPLTFVDHDFEVHCYNTLRCRVIYNGSNFSPYKAEKERSPPPPSADYRDHWRFASNLGIRNFPPPAEVSWTSLDGVEHEAKVDIGDIFKDQRVLYNVPDSEIPDRSWGGEPGIILEVNDRTLSIYMKAFIATKTEQIPGNKNSDFRADVIQAWTHTY